jgi:hypothetical protein
LGRLDWQIGTISTARPVTPRTHVLDIDLPDWEGHLPGQHVDIRLTAEDGYQAQRSYSIASAPHPTTIELAVERLEDGEVSTYLTDVLVPGDQLELRGPIGGYFTWMPADGGPVLLVAGGSGVAPLMSMIRERFAQGSDAPMRSSTGMSWPSSPAEMRDSTWCKPSRGDNPRVGRDLRGGSTGRCCGRLRSPWTPRRSPTSSDQTPWWSRLQRCWSVSATTPHGSKRSASAQQGDSSGHFRSIAVHGDP